MHDTAFCTMPPRSPHSFRAMAASKSKASSVACLRNISSLDCSSSCGRYPGSSLSKSLTCFRIVA